MSAGASPTSLVAANADAMRKIINALRQAGGRELATQWVSVYPYTDETGQANGYAASNSVSATSDVGDGDRVFRRSGVLRAGEVGKPDGARERDDGEPRGSKEEQTFHRNLR